MGQSAFQVKQINNIPWILPGNIATGQSLSFSLGNLAGSNTPLQGISTGNFQLSWAGPIAQIITIGSFNLFDITAGNRKAIRDSFDAFIMALDGLETGKNLVAGGARIVAQVTAQYLPLPLPEIPLYAFNLVNPLLFPFLQATQTYMDIAPGMRLTAWSGSLYQESLSNQNFPAYGGTGTLTLSVSTIPGTNLLAYEPFIDQMGIHVPLNTGSKLRVASGAFDLMSAAELKPYNRIFYPSPPGNGFTAINLPNNNPADNATIVRAGAYADMLQYTASFPYCCQAADGRCALFAGRTQVVPEISLRVNGDTIFITVGTTLKHLVERSYQGVGRPKKLQFTRSINEGRANIIFENATIGFDMFLLPGDDISW